MLPIVAKESFKLMVPLIGWMLFMHYFDLSFNITPVLHPHGYPFQWAWLDFGCLALMIGVLSKIFIARLALSPAYPIKDPRLNDILGEAVPAAAALQPSGGNQ
jgi:hypothetical protein